MFLSMDYIEMLLWFEKFIKAFLRGFEHCKNAILLHLVNCVYDSISLGKNGETMGIESDDQHGLTLMNVTTDQVILCVDMELS